MIATRNMLLVAYHFPPMGGSGVQRPAKFAAHLPRCGWNPIVLCAGHARYPVSDASLCDELPSSVRIERFAGTEPAGIVERMGKWLPSARLRDRLYWLGQRMAQHDSAPEPQWHWANSARARAAALCRQHDISAVLTSGPPFSTHLVGLHLKRTLGLPWIAEFRDPLTSNYTYAPRSPREDNYWRWLESETLRRADRVVVTCEDLAEDFRRRLPEAAAIHTITNGWDPADFPVPATVPGRANAKFTLRYVGAFYRQQSIEPMLCAIRLWLAREPQWIGRFRFEAIGSLSATQLKLIEPGDERFLHLRGYASHADAVEAMCTADALYLTAADAPGGELYIPAKTFEYLASGRPILATIPSGTSLDRLLQSAEGVRICPHAPEALSAALSDFARDVNARRLDALQRRDLLSPFRRTVLARKLAALLDEVAGRESAINHPAEAAV